MDCGQIPSTQGVGFATPNCTQLSNAVKGTNPATLNERVNALLLDPGCHALLISANPEVLEKSGLPLDHIDRAVIRGSLSDETAALLRDCCDSVVAHSESDTISLLSLVDEVH